MSRAEACRIVAALDRLVACAGELFAPGTVIPTPYLVESDGREYAFPSQPFMVVRRLTRAEYFQALPKGLNRGRGRSARYYYEITTD